MQSAGVENPPAKSADELSGTSSSESGTKTTCLESGYLKSELWVQKQPNKSNNLIG